MLERVSHLCILCHEVLILTLLVIIVCYAAVKNLTMHMSCLTLTTVSTNSRDKRIVLQHLALRIVKVMT